MFYLITPTGVKKCWGGGNAYMLETEVIYNDILPSGTRGRMSKKLLAHLLATDEGYDIRSDIPLRMDRSEHAN